MQWDMLHILPWAAQTDLLNGTDGLMDTKRIKKKDCVEHLSSTSLPIGVMNSIEIDSVKRRLGDGDFVIMVTDGVLDALPVGEQDILLETIIQGSAITNPKEMAQHVLEQVLNWTGKEPADDMTVLAVGIWEC